MIAMPTDAVLVDGTPVCDGCDQPITNWVELQPLQQDHNKDEHDQEHNPVHAHRLPHQDGCQP